MDLVLEISQKQKLSQKMLLSTSILQMGSVELTEYLKNVSSDNPVVEIEDNFFDSVDKYKDLNDKLDSTYHSDFSGKNYQYANNDKQHTSYENFCPETNNTVLGEHLMDQVYFLRLSKRDRQIIEHIVLSLDDKGYFNESLVQIGKHYNVDAGYAEALLTIIQNLDPAGVGARSLSECLKIQMLRAEVYDETADIIIHSYLEQLGKNHLPAIAKETGKDLDDVLRAAQIIRSLNPKPAQGFSSGDAPRFIRPDIIISQMNGKFDVALNDASFPVINISSYYKKLSKETLSKEATSYIIDKIKQAEWIVNCIRLRNETLLNIMDEIIRIQQQFFLKGPQYVVPMKLNDIAAQIDKHASTVSRAIKDKYLQCSWGIYPLRFFFCHSIETDGGKDKTPNSVKEAIKAIIHNEDAQNPKSDREITDQLVTQGIKISRRTTAKYREEMQIPKAQCRKSYDLKK